MTKSEHNNVGPGLLIVGIDCSKVEDRKQMISFPMCPHDWVPHK